MSKVFFKQNSITLTMKLIKKLNVWCTVSHDTVSPLTFGSVRVFHVGWRTTFDAEFETVIKTFGSVKL